MRPRRSGGGTAHDPVDITLSDTEPVSSDAPQFVASTNPKPLQSSASAIAEVAHGKRVRSVEETPAVPAASTSQLAREEPVAKRGRHGSSSVASVDMDHPMKKKNTARKSTQHISSAQRSRWEASRANSIAVAAEDSDDLTHEEAMRQAAAERRRSQSIRKTSHSPSKTSVRVGLGPDTVPQSNSSHHGLGQEGEAVITSRTGAQSLSSHSTSFPADIQLSTQESSGDSPVSVSAPNLLETRVRPPPSIFQTSDTPGSWGSAIPMSVTHHARNRSNTPKSQLVAEVTDTAGISSSTMTNESSSQAASAEVFTEAPAQPARPARRGPTWKTAETPSPPPPHQLPTSSLSSLPVDQDELDTEEASLNQPGSGSGEQSLSDLNAQSSAASILRTYPSMTIDTPTMPDNSDLVDRMVTLPDLAFQQPELGSDKSSAPVSKDPGPSPPAAQTKAQVAPMPGQDTTTHTVASRPEIPLDVVTTIVPAQIHPEESTSFSAEVDLLLPFSELLDELPSDLLGDVDAALLDIMPHEPTDGIDQEIDIDDLTASLPAELDLIDLSRSRASSSGGSFEEIPAEIAKTQLAFPRPAATQTSTRLGLPQPVLDIDMSDAIDKRVFEGKFDNIAEGAGTRPETGPSRPIVVRSNIKDRADSNSSSGSGSPSKRLSSRLASRTLTPVYSFSATSRSPIKWRQTVEMDGESEVEDLLGTPSRAGSSSSSSMTINGIERTLTATFDIPIVDSPPPPERRSRGIRKFDTQLIDEWNKMSPRLTHNPALHRLIFESYIDQCVDGDEPEIKVYNTVDLESIPPHFEFQYSNKMLYNDDVPEPELGLGCDCEGGCSESSSTCSCLKRQQLYNYNINDGFAYDEHGHLKQPVPIWECGPNCGCPPECMNRVIQRGRTNKALIDLFKTRKKGWGVRARSAIPKGTFLGVYAGEIIVETESERRGLIYEKAGRTYLFDCDGYHIANPPSGLEEVDPRLAVLARDSAGRAAQAAALEEFPGVYNAYSIDAFQYGNFTRFFNHCCDPNLQIVQAYVHDFHPERPLLVIFTLHDVTAGEELCISYKGIPDEEEVVRDDTKKAGKRRKVNKPTTTATVHTTNKKIDQRDICYCGAANCDGIMFNRPLD